MLQPIENFEREEENPYVVFLDATAALIGNIIEARWLLSYQDMRDPLKDAWKEAKKHYESEQTQAEIRERFFYRRTEALHPATNVVDLSEYGLSGDQWEAKNSGFRFAYRRFLRRGGLRALKRVLKWINNILSSMVAALPSLDFLKEMKDLVEAVMDDTLDPAGHWM